MLHNKMFPKLVAFIMFQTCFVTGFHRHSGRRRDDLSLESPGYNSGSDIGDIIQTNAYQVPGYPPVVGELQVSSCSGKIYVFIQSSRVPWIETHLFCREHGMELLSFENEDEFEFVAEFIEAVGLNTPNDTHVALAIHDIDMEGEFTNLYTGRTFSAFYNAETNQPDNSGFGPSGREDCVEIASIGDMMYVNDADCRSRYSIICTFGVLECPYGRRDLTIC